MMELQGTRCGPVLALLGGVHGDEDEGVLAVLRILQLIDPSELAGTVRAVAPANPQAWAKFSRVSPLDQGNLARCFPGDPQGDPTQVLAAGITEAVIEGADFLIDLHSAGSYYAMPLLCGFVAGGAQETAARDAAIAFGTPFIWAHETGAPGRSLSVAAERGIPALYAECGGGAEVRGTDLQAYVAGVFNVMGLLKMLPKGSSRPRSTAPQWVFGSGDLDDGAQAGQHGLFVTSVAAADRIAAGAQIGILYDYHGNERATFRAPREGIVMFLRRKARVHPEDVLFVLGRVQDSDPRQEELT
ncbi:succinylglutamate desuccinylase/aspartoacylase family protein [Novosphingobium mathurense]|uniref:Succinylglutamate desuccinylase/Aspartoacylase catalytic domain-containing protein n=1 Tax=Novosphingobium mathurense TaxID=428990 RepID=A0A1U6IL89_9SPHN|nr:M14 family metallopeptidase [Novosphingobium mathurense]SLK08774.1 hypothetical protein SAMN06295987_108126 [Novosphingobium mathurense]